jgi:hypothetical protein
MSQDLKPARIVIAGEMRPPLPARGERTEVRGHQENATLTPTSANDPSPPSSPSTKGEASPTRHSDWPFFITRRLEPKDSAKS